MRAKINHRLEILFPRLRVFMEAFKFFDELPGVSTTISQHISKTIQGC